MDVKTIRQEYGNQVLRNAGLLTSKKAYYLWRRSPPVVTPPPGIKPTALPSNYCPPGRETRLEQNIQFLSAVAGKEGAAGKEGRVIIRYSYYGSIIEAVLRQFDNRWLVTSIKIIQPSYGSRPAEKQAKS